MLFTNVKAAIRAAQSRDQYTIYNGDCIEMLKSLPAEKVDLIISSPPYFVGKSYDTSSSHRDFSAEHERVIPFLVRALKLGGSICWQTGVHPSNGSILPLDYLAHSIFEKHKCLTLRNRIVWHFEHGVHARKRLSGRYETVLWYTKGESYVFNLDSIRVPQKYPGKRHYKGSRKGELSGNPLGKNPGDVWSIPNVKARHVEKTEHPCQFPVELPQRLVRALSNPGDMVLDPYSGVGSTGIAAVLEGRRYLGSEIDKQFAALSAERYRKWAEGKLLTRDWQRGVLEPDPRSSVARRPAHFWSVPTLT